VQHIKFTPAPEYLAKLQQAIRQAHGCDAEHLSTWMGVEHAGPLLWSGSVEVFQLKREGAAERVFAWSKIEGAQLHCYLVLATEKIRSPKAAVRHVLSSQAEEQELAAA